MIQNYPQALVGIGKLKDYKVHFYVKPDIRPIAQPQCSIPYHLQESFEKEVQEMESQGIIEEHHGPVSWLSNPQLVPKEDGHVRVTLDARLPNKAIQDTKVPIPRVDIKAKFARCRYYTKLDFRAAFHQLEFDEESKSLTTFYAGTRLMKYNRLTMGMLPASGELSKALRPIFAHQAHAHVIHDDIVIATKSGKDHKRAVEKAIAAIAAAGMTLNLEKCHFYKKSIKFWECMVSNKGIKPDPEKVKALDEAGPPKDKNELRSFLSMVQSQTEFIPGLAKETEFLRKLVKKNARFQWGKEETQEFRRLKKLF